jgi:NAD-dependent DNA ligase
MDYVGKILVAKKDCMISGVKMNEPLGSRTRFSGHRLEIKAGSMVLCTSWYKPLDSRLALLEGKTVNEYLMVLYKESFYEASPHYFTAIEPSEMLAGKTVCFTGDNFGSRLYWQTIVKIYGGKNVTGVSRDTSLLVMQDKNSKSTKAAMAKKHNTETVTYEEFEKMLGIS